MNIGVINNELRHYLINLGLDFGNYGSVFIKSGLIFMMEQSEIVYPQSIYKHLSLQYNKEIETIKKGIRVSINDALRRGVFNLDGQVYDKLSTKKAFILLYQGFIRQSNIFAFK